MDHVRDMDFNDRGGAGFAVDLLDGGQRRLLFWHKAGADHVTMTEYPSAVQESLSWGDLDKMLRLLEELRRRKRT